MAVIGSAVMSGSLGVLHAVRPDGLGRGDVKLGLVLGLVIGWTRSSPLDVGLAVSWALALSSAVGLAAVGVVALRGSTVDRSTTIAFGPALCVGSAGVTLAAPMLLG
jgi:leader peptidase (prepilin peptidase)/N-methyltransferase